MRWRGRALGLVPRSREGLLDAGVDGLHLVVGVDKALALGLGMQELAARDDLHLEIAGDVGLPDPADLKLAWETGLQVRLEPAEPGSVTSSASAIVNSAFELP